MSRPAAAPPVRQAPAHHAPMADTPTEDIAPRCRHYLGDRPCVHNRLCRGCPHFEPYSHRICIIKIGALGDVVRTLCLLPELRRRFPAGHVTWISKANGCRMLAGHASIDRLMPLDATTSLILDQEAFDVVINLDKEPHPSALAMSLRATTKLGIGLSAHGTPIPLNPEARPYFHLGLSDQLKFQQNTKSYPRLIYEAMGWTYHDQRYQLPVDDTARARISFYLAARGWRPNKVTLGINVGAGGAFANKMWPAPRIVEVIRQVQKRLPAVQVVLLGGPDERSIINAITARLKTQNALRQVIDGGTDHSEAMFVALVNACDVVFTGDTMAMHVAIALGKYIVAFFGATCQQEIDLFGKGQKLIADPRCAPCYKRVCDQDDICVHEIDAREATNAIERMVTVARSGGRVLPVTPTRMAG